MARPEGKTLLPSKNDLWIGAAIATFVTAAMGYWIVTRFEITSEDVVWTAVFALLFFTIVHLKRRGGPPVIPLHRPGVVSLQALFLVLIVVYIELQSDLKGFVSRFFDGFWPVLLGTVISWSVASFYFLYSHTAKKRADTE